jgi:hypothetical protein
VAEVVLDRPGIVPVVGQLVAAAMPQHVAVDEEWEAGNLASAGNHALVAGHGQRRQTLADEDVDGARTFSGTAAPVKKGTLRAGDCKAGPEPGEITNDVLQLHS